MAIATVQELRTALNSDLKKTGPGGLQEVVNDSLRKLFTARISGAILEFAHKQADADYWSGVKYYGSGSQSRIRVKRTRIEKVEASPARVASKAKAKLPRKRPAASPVAIEPLEAIAS
jgi:hypothetical protein